MNLIALAVCFLFIFCPPHHRVKSHAPQQDTVEPDQAGRTTRGQSCDQIVEGFDGNSDGLVSQFPVNQQRRVLMCLDKLAKRQGK